jgi:hypothetical protein
MMVAVRMEDAAKKQLFYALRFATRTPAAARKCYFRELSARLETVP